MLAVTIHMNVHEYDISQCNINIFKSLGILDNELYEILRDSDKMFRQVYVGKHYLANGENYTKYKDAMNKIMEIFVMSNNLVPENILITSYDAIFTNVKCRNLVMSNNIRFVNKNSYTTMINFKFHNRETQLMLKLDNKMVTRGFPALHPKVFTLLHEILLNTQARENSLDRDKSTYNIKNMAIIKKLRELKLPTLIDGFNNNEILELLFYLSK